MKNALGESDRTEYYTFFNMSSELLCILDGNFAILECGSSWKTKLGYDPDKLTGRKLAEFLDREIVHKETNTEEEFAASVQSGDGRWIKVVWKIHKAEEKYFLAGRISSTNRFRWRKLGQSNNIKKAMHHRSISEELRVSEEMYRQLFENMTNGFSLHEVIFNEAGEPVDFLYVMVNAAHNRIMGVGDEVIGKSVREVNPMADEGMIQAYCKVGMTGEPFHKEYYSKTFRKYISVYAFSPMKGRFACIFEDVTLRKEAEKALQAAKEAAEEASSSKSRFLANMSHEIRTPMNGILGFLDILQQSGLTGQQQIYLREAKTATELLLQLINDILDFSKIEAKKLTMERIQFDLRSAIESSVGIFVPWAAEKNVDINILLQKNLRSAVYGDPSRIKQILNNLISNALKFTDSGDILITAEVQAELGSRAIFRIEVRDTGIGLSEEDRLQLFKPFTQADASMTRKYGGTGLGLAITKELVGLMGGEIGVTSKMGEGALFYFTICLETCPDERREGVEQEIAELQGQKVLVVDDNSTSRFVLRSYLEEFGCSVIEASSAAEAMGIILKDLHLKSMIQLAVIDNNMPDVTGNELAITLGTIPEVMDKDLKLLLMTSMNPREEGDTMQVSTYAANISTFLPKPVTRSELLKGLLEALRVKEQQDIACGEDETTDLKHGNEGHTADKEAYSPRILLVEDNEMNRNVVITILRRHGMSCEIAVNGLEALEAVLTEDYDIVFMDCQMPIMDGFEATRRIRNSEGNRKHTKIIAMTANAMSGDREKCMNAGMDEYISKPVDFNFMFELIGTSIRHKPDVKIQLDFLEKSIALFMKETGIDQSDATELFEQYTQTIPSILDQIDQAYFNGELEEIRRLSHQLKGSSGNLRVHEIYELSAALEVAAGEKKMVKCKELIQDIRKMNAINPG